MKKPVVTLGRILTILLLLAGLSVCTMPGGPAESPPEEAVSFDQLLAGLDELQGSTTQSPSAPGMSVFTLPNGSLLSSADLSAYLNAIKRDLAAYVYSCTGGAPYLVTAKSVTFNVTYPQPVGTVRESGLVWVPFSWNPWRKFPVISYQHGTQVNRTCAPSCFNANPLAILVHPDLTGAFQNHVECIVGGLMASAGYVVAMPDYAGFGSSHQPHPYVHLSLGNSVAGIVAHARSSCKGSSTVYLTGYSEGGYATMAGALALKTAGAPPIRVVPCDGPYDLSGTMLDVMLDDQVDLVPSYLLYTAAGYKAAYPALDYGTFLEPAYASIITGQHPFDGDHTNAFVDGLGLPAVAANMIDGWPLSPPTTLKAGGTVFTWLEANNAWNGWGTMAAPVFVHSMADDIVPPANATVAAGKLGSEIRWVAPVPFIAPILGSKHIAAFPTAMLAAFRVIRGD